MVKDLRVVFGKGDGSEPVPHDANGRAPMWKKKSIFWELPYWEILEVRNAIDVMHLTKNLCLNVLGFLGCYKNSKDTLEARRDLKNIHRNEAPPIEVDEEEADPEEVEEEEQDYLGPASYTLSKEEKDIMFDCLNSMQVPFGYSSNIKGIISMKDKNYKSKGPRLPHVDDTVTSSCVEGCSSRESTISIHKALCISQCNFTEGNRSKEPSEATK
jgi:hypothetical protein